MPNRKPWKTWQIGDRVVLDRHSCRILHVEIEEICECLVPRCWGAESTASDSKIVVPKDFILNTQVGRVDHRYRSTKRMAATSHGQGVFRLRKVLRNGFQWVSNGLILD